MSFMYFLKGVFHLNPGEGAGMDQELTGGGGHIKIQLGVGHRKNIATVHESWSIQQ